MARNPGGMRTMPVFSLFFIGSRCEKYICTFGAASLSASSMENFLSFYNISPEDKCCSYYRGKGGGEQGTGRFLYINFTRKKYIMTACGRGGMQRGAGLFYPCRKQLRKKHCFCPCIMKQQVFLQTVGKCGGDVPLVCHEAILDGRMPLRFGRRLNCNVKKGCLFSSC